MYQSFYFFYMLGDNHEYNRQKRRSNEWNIILSSTDNVILAPLLACGLQSRPLRARGSKHAFFLINICFWGETDNALGFYFEYTVHKYQV